MKSRTASAMPGTVLQDTDWEANISAWVDGEADLRAEELDNPYGRQVWDTYHLIGDVMRSADLAIRPSDRFYARISAALDAEPVPPAPAAWWRRPALRQSLAGLAAAAAVASVVWVNWAAWIGPQPVDTAPLVALAPAVDPTPMAASDARLDGYMAAHRAMTGAAPIRQVASDPMGRR